MEAESSGESPGRQEAGERDGEAGGWHGKTQAHTFWDLAAPKGQRFRKSPDATWSGSRQRDQGLCQRAGAGRQGLPGGQSDRCGVELLGPQAPSHPQTDGLKLEDREASSPPALATHGRLSPYLPCLCGGGALGVAPAPHTTHLDRDSEIAGMGGVHEPLLLNRVQSVTNPATLSVKGKQQARGLCGARGHMTRPPWSELGTDPQSTRC